MKPCLKPLLALCTLLLMVISLPLNAGSATTQLEWPYGGEVVKEKDGSNHLRFAPDICLDFTERKIADGSTLKFKNAEFEQGARVIFEGAKLGKGSNLLFDFAEFRKGTRLMLNMLELGEDSRVRFTNAKFEKGSELYFRYSKFAEGSELNAGQAWIAGMVNLSDATFDIEPGFENSIFVGDLYLTGSRFNKGIDWRRTDFLPKARVFFSPKFQ